MKKIWKQVLSAGLVIALVITMINIIPRDNSLDVTHAADDQEKVSRGVVDSLSQLPQYQNPDFLQLERGSKDRPFVVLEIVPYEEYATFGYLISGCEPINLDQMHSSVIQGISQSLQLGVNNGNGSYNNSYSLFNFVNFFKDELDKDQLSSKTLDRIYGAGNWKWINATDDYNVTPLKGYYEIVADGTGTFRYTIESIEPDDTEEPEAPTESPESEPTETPEPELTETAEPTEAPEPEPTETTEPTEAPEPEPTETAEATEAPEPEPTETAEATEAPEPELTETAEATEAPEPEPTKSSETSESSSMAYNNMPQMKINYVTENGDADTASDNETLITAVENSESGTDDSTQNNDETDEQSEDINDEAFYSEPFDDSEEQDSDNAEADSETEADDTTVTSEPDDNMTYDLEDEKPQYIVTIEPAPAHDGNLVWHTVYDTSSYADDTWTELTDRLGWDQDAQKELIENDILHSTLFEIGDRLYTYRTRTQYEEYNQAIDEAGEGYLRIFGYYIWENNDNFLRYSVIPGATDEQIKNYSIVVKTITPDELNAAPEWVDYSDLIYLAAQVYPGSGFIQNWKDYNRLGRTSNLTNYSNSAGFDIYDINWNVTLKIFDKVTAENNFAAIIIDNNLYDTGQAAYNWKDVTSDMYDWNLRKTEIKSPAVKSSNKNIYKLCMMLFTMDTDLFKLIYRDPSNPVFKEYQYTETITDGYGVQREVTRTTGQLTLQTGDASIYWGTYTFPLVQSGIYMESGDLFGYFTHNQKYDNEQWNKFHFNINPTESRFKSWANGHVFTFKGDSNVVQYFMTGHIDAGDAGTMSQDFYDYLSDSEKGNASAKEAIRYILGTHENKNPFPDSGKNLTLRILDLEPSVGLLSDDTPDWFLQESYVHMLLPDFKGKIEITHQTTAEFIGKIEDLNSTYDLIYMGLDIGGYNTKTENRAQVVDWNDDSLDGKIYIRTGDLAYSKEGEDGSKESIYYGYLTGAWLLNKTAFSEGKTRKIDLLIDKQDLRFSGNDISKLKMNELVEYLNAGYPIVVEQRLYELNKDIMEESTYVYQLIKDYQSSRAIIGTANTDKLEEAVKNALGDDITFVQTPVLYDGVTATPTTADFRTIDEKGNSIQRYLPRDSSGNAYLYFKINAAKEGYRYLVYVDLNRDSRFSDDEIMNITENNNNVLRQGENEYIQKLPADWLGMLQWKVEVYFNENPYIRYEISGCSAVDRNTYGGTNNKKEQVKVLQIMPDDSNKQGYLNLETNELFIKYYSELEDYDVSITSIPYREYVKYFYHTNEGRTESWNFSYDYTAETGENNPANLNNLTYGGTDYAGKLLNLMDYDMFIVGFGDCYGMTRITNEYGQIDFLRYFVDQGKSILFTHDLTAFYNKDTDDYSFYPTTMLRDIMGMNRFGAISYYVYTAINTGNNTVNGKTVIDRLIKEQTDNADMYDTNNTELTHGYTYFAIKRMGLSSANNKTYKVPYKYIAGYDFNSANDPTTRATKVNEGQITVYPYYIDDELKVSPTHAQYYQLNPEDDNLTVWYCVAGDNHPSIPKDANSSGTSLTYAVSPNDVVNNYYIYSKGNIFYSGVGHYKVDYDDGVDKGDMEAKLFVNTIIAAYNARSEAPRVEVTNPEAVATGVLEYEIDVELLQAYDFGNDGELVGVGDAVNVNDYVVTFVPQDYNLASGTKLECTIQWSNGTYVERVTRVYDGKTFDAENINGKMVFKNLEKGIEYSLIYPAEYLNNDVNIITFTIKNNRIDDSNTTTLKMNMSTLPLFPLD